MLIPLQDIAVINRGRKDLGDVQELADSIAKNDQITAGVVRTAVPEDGVPEPYVLVAGERRFRACFLAGKESFLCIDKGELPVRQQIVLELEENLHRKDLDWHEESALRKRIHDLNVELALERGERWTNEDTARQLHESTATISRDLQVAKAIERDPTLKAAGSKKAAIRVLDMRQHLLMKELDSNGTAPSGKLSSLLVCADASDWLRAQPTASVDLVLTDYPYGLGMDNLYKAESGASRPISEYEDSGVLDLYADTVPEVLRITKLGGWICTTISESSYEPLRELFESCCVTHFEYGCVVWEQQVDASWVKHLPTECPKSKDGRECLFLRAELPRWMWYRPNSQNPTRFPDKHAKNYYEPLLVLNRGAAKLYKSQCPNVLVYDADYGDERTHVMQKPLGLAVELTQRFTQPGDLVADPFFGSGNLLAGAASVGRKVRGCELNSLMIDLALGRVAEYAND